MAEALQETFWGSPERVEVDWEEQVQEEKQQPMADPRPDLTYDSSDWIKLLQLAQAKNKMLAGTLHGFRCGGLRLHRGGKGYALRPDFDPKTSIWTSKTDYEDNRNRWLMPYQKEIVELLKLL